MSDIAIKVEGLSKQYRLGQVGTGTLGHDLNRWWARIRGKEDPFLKIGETNDRSQKGDSEYVWSLKDINFEVKQGEVLGIIGKNGAGKSTLLKILSKVTGPTSGRVMANGRIGALLEVGTGFHPELTGRENIFLNGAILGMTKVEIKSKLDEIIDFSGCARYVDTPVKRYSSGMKVRLAFAVAAFLEPEILIVDEVLAVGDAEFQKKAIGKMQDVSKGEGRTVLFVSHNMVAVQQLCENVLVLDNGKVSIHSDVNEGVEFYRNSSLSIKSEYYKDCKQEIKSKISCIQILNNNQVSRSSLDFGEPFSIKVQLVVKEMLRNPIMSVRISNSSNINIVNFKTNESIDNPLGHLLENEAITLLLKVEALYLLNDIYHVSIGFADGKEVLDVVINEVSFEVVPNYLKGVGYVTKANTTNSILFHESNWSVDRQGEV